MARKLKEKRLDTTMGVRVPEHFYKSIKAKAKELKLTLTDYVTAVLIREMRTGIVYEDIKVRIAEGNMFWAMYPKAEDIYQDTPSESELLKRAYEVSHQKKTEA